MQNQITLLRPPEQRVAYATQERRGCFAREPELGDILHDPMTLALMAADRVDRRELEILLAGVRENLR